MAVTKKARSELRVRVSSHGEDASYASDITPTGLIRTTNGLVIPPSDIGGGVDTRTGALADLTDAEKLSLGIEDMDEPTVEQVSEPEAPVADKPTTKTGKKKKVPLSKSVQDSIPQVERVTLTGIPGLGDVPTQYVRFMEGVGCLVIGLDKFSYVPVAATLVDGELRGSLSFAEIPGRRYAYLGHRFKMDGTDYLILIELPKGE